MYSVYFLNWGNFEDLGDYESFRGPFTSGNYMRKRRIEQTTKHDLLNLLWVVADMNFVRVSKNTFKSERTPLNVPSLFNGDKDKLKRWAVAPSQRGFIVLSTSEQEQLSAQEDWMSFESVLMKSQLRFFKRDFSYSQLD